MKIYNLTKLAKGLLISAALITSVVACGNKNKDNQNLNAFQQSCTNCQNISGLPFFNVQTTAQSMSYYGSQNAMRLTMSFSGQNVGQQQQGQNQNQYNPYVSPAMNYSGQVSVIGTVTVSALLNLGFCPQVPAGNYNLATQTVGTWNQGQVSGIRLIISGPVTMTAILTNTQATEYTYGYSSSSRLNGNMQIEQVNGYYCQGANFYLY